MTKEIARTAGGKRVAWLLAILAAFAVFATVGNQWRESNAAMPATTLTLGESVGASAAVNPGSTITYTLTMTTSAVNTNGAVVMTINLPTGATYAAAAVPTCPAAAVGGVAITWTASAAGATPPTCTSSGVLTAAIAAGGVMTAAVTADATGTVSAAVSGTVRDVDNINVTATNNTTSHAINGVAPINGANVAAGQNATVSFTIPIGLTYCSDVDGNAARTFVQATDVVAGADTTIVSSTAGLAATTATDTLTVVLRRSVATAGPVSATVRTHLATSVVGTDCLASGAASATTVIGELRHMAQTPILVNPAVTMTGGTSLTVSQDLVNNVRGSRHVACVVAANTGLPNNTAATALAVPLLVGGISVSAGGGYTDINQPDPTFTDATVFTGDGNNGGIAGATCFSWVSTEAGDQEITATYTGADGLSYTMSWDTDANGNGGSVLTNKALIKEWNVLEDSALTVTQGSATLASASTTQPLVIGVTAAVFNPANSRYDFTDIVIADTFRGSHTTRATSKIGPISLAGVNWGITAITAGSCGAVANAVGQATVVTTLAVAIPDGVATTVTLAAGHGVVAGNWLRIGTEVMQVTSMAGDVATVVRGVVDPLNPVNSSNVVVNTTAAAAAVNSTVWIIRTTTTNADGTVGTQPNFVFTPDLGAPCNIDSFAEITIKGAEPYPLGSGVGKTVTEVIRINITTPPLATKQVFLAWAGQRVILEHDWRLPPGDVDGGSSTSVVPAAGSVCAVSAQSETFQVTHIKGAGPGNFVAGLGATLNGSDQATVTVQSADVSQTDIEDIIAQPQGSCISRVLYESEDQGQVDVEAFILTGISDPLNQTKIAFVIYYMKLESVAVSLVDDVAKPTHNGTGKDYSPGNPWDASKDVTTVDWNVSKDLLVRGRVKGWFTTSNPSGRAAGTDSNGGGLPAGRWTMPDDWPLLAGGPADPADGSDAAGIAEAYRPEFDIMIAPNNKVGRSLVAPEGTGASIAVTTLAVAITPTATSPVTITVADGSQIGIGACLTIDSENFLVTGKAGNSITATRGSLSVGCLAGVATAAAGHAAGATITITNYSGVPFEGPYSLLDIPGLSATGFGSAALSDWDPNNVRDTIWQDGDVDMWDAPMPPSLVTVDIRGAGFIKQVIKDAVYYIGTADTTSQVYPNPFYIVDIPDSPFIPAVVAGGGYIWDTWGNDGPSGIGGPNAVAGGNGDGVYRFWTAARIGSNIFGVGDTTLSAANIHELRTEIRAVYNDATIDRTLVVYSDNHGEFMVTANGDFKLDYSGCATNVAAGGKHCKRDDKVGASTITAVADYPDFRGKHYPLGSNAATVNWTWGGYKDVTVEAGETNQFKYVVFHAVDRDGFCAVPTGAVSLHPVLSSADALNDVNGSSTTSDVVENVDFLIDAGEGIIVGQSGGGTIGGGNNQFATNVQTYSWAANNPAVSGIKEFPLSSLAATGATDECQAWIRVSNSLLGIIDLLVTAHDDEGDIAFDRIIDLQGTTSYSLSFRWTLITWVGADDIAPDAALKGTESPDNPATNNIFDDVTALYGWDAAAQDWLGFFPDGVGVPGANDLTKLDEGSAYWIAIEGPNAITWTVATNVN